MRRARTLLFGGLFVVGMLVGPGVASAAPGARVVQPPPPVIVATGWTCHPNGSGAIGGPSTTLSWAIIVASNHHLDRIICFFPTLGQGTVRTTPVVQNGGQCYYNSQLGVIEFAHRIWISAGNTATLTCWDGTLVCPAVVTAPANQVCVVLRTSARRLALV